MRPFLSQQSPTLAERTVADPTLYRRTLGETFNTLPAVLRAFHDLPDGGRAQGNLRVTRGAGWVRSALATLMRMPAVGDAVPVTLEVRAANGREQWIRTFGKQRLITWQWQRGDLLIEAAGPLRFGFRLTNDAQGMRFSYARTWLLGLPLPLPIAPRVSAEVQGRPTGWHVCVRVELPGIGLLACYEGELTP